MSELSTSDLFRRITRLRWQAPLLALLLVLTHQIVEHTWLIHLSRWEHFATQVVFYGLIGPILAWWALTSLRRSVAETVEAEKALKEAHIDLGQVNEQLACLLKINRRLTEVQDEDELLSVILALPLEVVPAVGCSLIPFDDNQRPLPPLHHGQLDTATMEAWAAHLADREVWQQCSCCLQQTSSTTKPCPLLSAAPDPLIVGQVFCLELNRGHRAYGMLNIYLPARYTLSEQEGSLLQAMAQEMSLALESNHLRSRELEMLSRLQGANRLDALHESLADVLTHTVEALGVDGGVLFVVNNSTSAWELKLEVGQPLGTLLTVVRGLAVGAGDHERPLVIRDLEQAEEDSIRSLLVAPLRTDNHAVGSLVLWANRPDAFTRRRMQLVAIVAGQAALLIGNQRLFLHGEHQAALAERTRLAREIHDGLAQTLGYLKLRTAQIASWLQEGKSGRVEEGLADIRKLLNEAYTDAREAIDGLHLQNADGDIGEWMVEVLSEFEMLSGLPVESTSLPQVTLPLEVQLQLQRIIQETLSNIRKHAQASRVWFEWQVTDGWLDLNVHDDGCGFDPEVVPPLDRHGLRIMQERAKLLRAELQITSRPNSGTTVTIELPLEETQMGVKNV